jgi:hypothetical protein
VKIWNLLRRGAKREFQTRQILVPNYTQSVPKKELQLDFPNPGKVTYRILIIARDLLGFP